MSPRLGDSTVEVFKIAWPRRREDAKCSEKPRSEKGGNPLQVIDESRELFTSRFVIGRPEDCRRMDGCYNELGKRGAYKLTALFGDSEVLSKQSLCCGRAKANHDPRFEKLDFSFQPGPARVDLLSVGLFVYAALSAGPPFEMLHNVGDVYLATVEPAVASAESSSFPAGPTKGRPDRSSSFPVTTQDE